MGQSALECVISPTSALQTTLMGRQAVKLATLVKNLDETSSRFDMEISAEKTNLMTNSGKQISTKIKVGEQELETEGQFK